DAWKMLRSLPPYVGIPLRCLQFRRVDVAEHVHAFGAVRCAWKMLRSLPPYGRLPLRCLQLRWVGVAEHVHAFGVVRRRRVEDASQSSTLRPSPAPVLTVS